MKVREGFVSNSSSSSFILVTKEPITEEFLRREYGPIAGKFAEPLIEFLRWGGSDELYDRWEYGNRSIGYFGQQAEDGRTPEEDWKRSHGIEPEAHIREYEITNQGEGSVSSALYYHGHDHLQTPNIRVFFGTRHG